MKHKISVAIATFNEQEMLEGCLESVVSWVDEIVIVDGGSSDKTVAIAKKYKANVIETTNPAIFHINKQKAVDACHGDWILQLDADEIVTKELSKEIQAVIQMTQEQLSHRVIDPSKKRLFERHQKIIEERDGKIGNDSDEVVAFFLPRKNYFLGKLMTYAGMYPDGVVRFFKKGKARFPAKSVHEQIHVDGRVTWLANDLVHLSNPTLNKYIVGANKYTNLLADTFKNEHVSKTFFSFIYYFFIKPPIVFFNLFIRHKGIWDGLHGFLFSLFSSLHFPVAFIKYILQKE